MTKTRRDFLKKSLVVLSATPVAASIIKTEVAKAEASTLKVVDPESAQAKALGYIHDASKVDVTKYPKKAGADSAMQNCASCILLQEKGIEAAGQEGKWGKCSLFMNSLVNEKGWCNSWVKNPNA